MKSPSLIVDTVLWLNEIVSHTAPGESLNLAVVNALDKEEPAEAEPARSPGSTELGVEPTEIDVAALADAYEYISIFIQRTKRISNIFMLSYDFLL